MRMTKERLMDPLKSAVALIADDDPSFRNEMVKILELFFKQVIQASNGIEALEYFEKYSIDVVFLDYHMPKFNGYETAVKIRLSSKSIPIIFISGNLEESKFINMLKIKTEYFLKKPFYQKDIFELITYLKNLLREQKNNTLLIINDEYTYDFQKKILFENSLPIQLTKNESRFIEVLLANKSFLVSTQQIENEIFNDVVNLNNLRNLVYRLRRKLTSSFIVNVKDLGYLIP